MAEDDRVFDKIVEEVTALKAKHSVPRRTLIKPDEGVSGLGYFGEQAPTALICVPVRIL